MECPVCKTITSKEDQTKCGFCDTDLEIFRLIEKLEKVAKKRKRINLVLSVSLVLFAIAAIVSYYYYIDLNHERQHTDAETMAHQRIEIQNLTNEKQVLMTSIIELRKEIELLNNKVEKLSTQTTPPNTPTTPAFREITHVVKRGESLQRIAKKYYGNGDEYRRIMHDNNIRNANHIKVNQRLKIIVPVTD